MTKSLVKREDLVTFFYCPCVPRKTGVEDTNSKNRTITWSSGFT
ncbi:MAG: hypothetical protein U0L97_05040 [Candidatus Saccharimonadaceae bacterium]|nr:hypothetical protein [Candidatus Saccharimonadaceae bacterium]